MILTIPEADYHADRSRLSASAIEVFRRRRRLYHRQFVLGEPGPPPSPPMVLGSYFHCLVLERDKVDERYVAPERAPTKLEWWNDPRNPDHGVKKKRPSEDQENKPVNRQIASWAAHLDAWEAEHDGRILSPELADTALPMVAALMKHEHACALLFEGPGHNEAVLHWTDPDTGRPMRCRLDRLLVGDTWVKGVELKTDRDADPDNRGNIARWDEAGYHRKAAVYLDAMQSCFPGKHATLDYVMVENSDDPGVCVKPLEIDNIAVQIGRNEYHETILDIIECEASGDWRQPWEKGPQPYLMPLWKVNEQAHEENQNTTFGGVRLGDVVNE